MWKSTQRSGILRVSDTSSPAPVPAAQSPAPPTPEIEPVQRAHVPALPVDQSVIGKGLKFKGMLTGTDSLYIDGTVDGTICIPGQRVTIGLNGHVMGSMTTTMNPCITAREIVVMGNVTGNIAASDRVEIRAEGKLLGDVNTLRISIADGAYFKGEVDLCRPDVREADAEDRDRGNENEASAASPADAGPVTVTEVEPEPYDQNVVVSEAITETQQEIDTVALIGRDL